MADRVDAGVVQAWLRGFAAKVHDARDELTALDSAIGDADHGSNLDRGMTAVVEGLSDDADPAALLKQAGMTLVSKVGGASGPLYGTFFLRAAGAMPAEGADASEFAAALRAGVEGVVARGKAELGDKTMLDTLLPACDTLEARLAEGDALPEALRAAADAGATGRDATTPMVARKGRASYLGDRSAGHQDPGATSAAMLLAAAAEAVAA
ncbi:MAG: dihydroxyacetone kinase subunit DhaL [Actinomycetes bacterium]